MTSREKLIGEVFASITKYLGFFIIYTLFRIAPNFEMLDIVGKYVFLSHVGITIALGFAANIFFLAVGTRKFKTHYPSVIAGIVLIVFFFEVIYFI